MKKRYTMGSRNEYCVTRTGRSTHFSEPCVRNENLSWQKDWLVTIHFFKDGDWFIFWCCIFHNSISEPVGRYLRTILPLAALADVCKLLVQPADFQIRNIEAFYVFFHVLVIIYSHITLHITWDVRKDTFQWNVNTISYRNLVPKRFWITSNMLTVLYDVTSNIRKSRAYQHSVDVEQVKDIKGLEISARTFLIKMPVHRFWYTALWNQPWNCNHQKWFNHVYKI